MAPLISFPWILWAQLTWKQLKTALFPIAKNGKVPFRLEGNNSILAIKEAALTITLISHLPNLVQTTHLHNLISGLKRGQFRYSQDN